MCSSSFRLVEAIPVGARGVMLWVRSLCCARHVLDLTFGRKHRLIIGVRLEVRTSAVAVVV